MKIYLKSVKNLEDKYLNDLVNILNTDKKLSKRLGSDRRPLSCAKFVAYNKQWSKKNKAEIYAIIMHHEAIGLISLSRIDRSTQTARIGYWIASKYWNKGYTSKAFAQMLDLAKEANIKLISCSISKKNRESKVIWQKFNAEFIDKGDNIVPLLHI